MQRKTYGKDALHFDFCLLQFFCSVVWHVGTKISEEPSTSLYRSQKKYNNNKTTRCDTSKKIQYRYSPAWEIPITSGIIARRKEYTKITKRIVTLK